MHDPPRPLTEHLEELRRRLLWSLSAIGVGFAIAFGFKERTFEILMLPAIAAVREAGLTLITIAPAELFLSYLKTALLAGFLATLPFTLYQGWAFVSPGLYANEKRLAVPFVLSTTLLFLAGNLFGYHVAFPFVFDFFLGLESDYVTSQWTTEKVFSFMSRLYLAFGLSFQLPVVMFFLATARIVSVEQMARSRRYAIVVMFLVGAILTPPDVVSQVALAGPLIALYELGLVAARLSLRRSAAREQPASSS